MSLDKLSVSFLFLVFIVFSISLSSSGGGNILSKSKKETQEILTPFECGFESFCVSRVSFSLQFFLLTLLFLIFDIEIIFILPFPLLKLKTLFSMLGVSLLIFIFYFGIFLEWKNDHLDWI